MTLSQRLGRSAVIEWRHDTPEDVIDIFSFHRAERLKVHEARTEAEVGSRVIQVTRWHRNLCHARHRHPQRSVWAAKRAAKRRAERAA